jgi:hypothetical protein
MGKKTGAMQDKQKRQAKLGSQEQEQTPIHATLFCAPLGNAHYK